MAKPPNNLEHHERSVGVLFVCLGNICRSPLAEGVFRHLVREQGLDGQRARQVTTEDFTAFDYVVAMDRDNLRALERLRRGEAGEAHLVLLRDHDPDPGDGEVPDPYYGGPGGFDEVFDMVRRSAEALLDEISG